MTCSQIPMPAGLQKTCGANFEKVKNIFIVDNVTFDSVVKVQSQAEWIKAIREDLTIWGGRVLNSYETTTDDANTVTFDSTRKRDVTRPIPSGLFYFDTNFCDTKELLKTLKNVSRTVVFELNNGSLHITMGIDGKIKGFAGTLNAITKGIAQPSGVGNNAPVKFYGDSYNEWENGVLIPMDFSLTDLIETYSPLGLTLHSVGKYDTTAGEIAVHVDVRGQGGLEGLSVTDFEIVRSSNIDTPDITGIEIVGNGDYILTIQKGVTPVNLAVGDFVVVRVKVAVGSIVSKVSNEIYISVNE